MNNKMNVISGTLLDDKTRFSLFEFCEYGKVSAEYVIEMVNEGILEPSGASVYDWVFDAAALKRLHTTRHLQRDLDINLAGAALVLQLLEEIEMLRQRLRHYE